MRTTKERLYERVKEYRKEFKDIKENILTDIFMTIVERKATIDIAIIFKKFKHLGN